MENSGVVLLGGAHGSLAVARSLGAQGIPVSYITHDSPLPGWSKFVNETISWPGPDHRDAIAFLLNAAEKHRLAGRLLVPAADPEVRLVSENVEALSRFYKIMLPPWDRLKWVCDKPLMYRRATELNLSIPRTYEIESGEQAKALDLVYPVILKPNMGGGPSHIAKAKVIRADDHDAFLAAYLEAAREIGAGNVIVQEQIPGGGESQFSYAALWHDGRPVAEFTARRTRQYPVDFGYTSTFVEVVDEPELIKTSRTLLTSIQHTGLVEIEFKRDRRSNTFKLLDVNPRPWSWFGLCAAAGLDLGAMMFALYDGRKVTEASARTGAAWMYLARDAVAAATLVKRGQIGLSDYFRSFASVRAWATYSHADPRPGFIDLPLTAWRVLTKRILRG